MTMDVLAEECPDLFQDIVPEEETLNAINSIIMDHDYRKKAEDKRSIANKNSNGIISSVSDLFSNTSFSTEESLNEFGVGIRRFREESGMSEERTEYSVKMQANDDDLLDKNTAVTLEEIDEVFQEEFVSKSKRTEQLVKMEANKDDLILKCVPLDEIDDILEDLAFVSKGINSNQFRTHLEIEKNKLGCSWSAVTNKCHHGDFCSFVRKILDLPTAVHSVPTDAGQNSVLKLKPTPKRNSKIQNRGDQLQSILQHSTHRINGSNKTRSSSLGFLPSVYHLQYKQDPVPPLGVRSCEPYPPLIRPSHSDKAMADISNQRIYRPAPNSVFVKTRTSAGPVTRRTNRHGFST